MSKPTWIVASYDPNSTEKEQNMKKCGVLHLIGNNIKNSVCYTLQQYRKIIEKCIWRIKLAPTKNENELETSQFWPRCKQSEVVQFPVSCLRRRKFLIITYHGISATVYNR